MAIVQLAAKARPAPVRILLIEDDESSAALVAALLGCVRWASPSVETVGTLREALARLTLERFDLVISDLNLPDSEGLATLQAVARACDRLIIVVTANDDPALREQALECGAYDLLHKGRLTQATLERLVRLATKQAASGRPLRDSEARFRKAFELAAAGMAHVALDGTFLRVNRRLCDILGYGESELVGRPVKDILQQASGERRERRFVRKDGAEVWLDLTVAPVNDPDGVRQYDVAVVEDITERKHAEARRAAHTRYQEAIAAFGQAALAMRDPGELSEEALRTVRRALGTEDVTYSGARLHVPGKLSDEAQSFLATAGSLLSTGLQRIESEMRASFLQQFDPLTGLPNRALLSDRFSQMILQAGRRGAALGVLFVDLDDFKLVNDTLGHAAGDELLREAARRLQSAVRPGDTLARISGDEFALVLADLARLEDAAPVAQKLLERLAEPFMPSGHETFVTASVGIAAFPADGRDAETLLGAAEAAMVRAKQSGRNSYQFFTAEITQRTRVRAQLALELRRAMERNEFGLVYQPKIDLASGKVCGAEALLRWHHPERGVIAPAEFVPVLEETGLIVPVGEWVVRRACEDLKGWQASGLKVLPVAVNLSARQFRQQQLDARIRSLVRNAGVAPHLIELEITESQLMQDPDHAIRVMNALRDAGIRIAIDDFGTGYSSLAYLTRFPVAALKIDRSFVADALSDAADAAIVRTIIDMAHTLNFTVVAEGVETDGQMDFLRQFGCEQGQGYLFARPMPAAELAQLIGRKSGSEPE
jgi:diguanylate cyclase (GGDEF)-like protein/PAS domain S-box-containing protein